MIYIVEKKEPSVQGPFEFTYLSKIFVQVLFIQFQSNGLNFRNYFKYFRRCILIHYLLLYFFINLTMTIIIIIIIINLNNHKIKLPTKLLLPYP
jgi:hypothetical protein